MTTRFVPFARSMAGYSRGRLRTDVVAGVTVAALALPASMAYAQLAGVPVSAGLYALLLPVLAYAFLGSAPRVAVGPEGTVALLVATAIAPLAASGSPQYAALAAMLAVMVGVVFLVARVARIGWIADYFSQAVLVGYITGVAVVLILGQLGKLVGISSDEDGAIGETIDILRHLGDANGVTVVVGAVSIALLVVAGRVNNRIPGALILVVAGIAASWALDLAGQGVSVTGPVPSGLPGLEVPDLSRGDVGSLVVAALAVFLVAFSDSILISRSFAARHHEVVDANQELLAFGVAQIAAGVTQGIPVGTSGSRTAVNDDMGATSQVSGLAAAATIAAILLFLTAPDPVPALGGARRDHRLCRGQADRPRAVAGAGSQQQGRGGHRRHHRRLCRHGRSAAGDRRGRGAVGRRHHPPRGPPRGRRARLVRLRGPVRRRRRAPRCRHHRGVVVYRIQDRLFFANAHFFKRRIWAAVDGAPKPVRHVVLDGVVHQRHRRQRRGGAA